MRRAAQMLGLSRESAYRLHRHPAAGSFVAAWNTALKDRTQQRWKFIQADRAPLAFGELLQPRMWRRRFVSIQRKASNSALLALLVDLDRLTAGCEVDPFADRTTRALFGRFG